MRARKAGPPNVADICRICRDGWRDTYPDDDRLSLRLSRRI